MECVGILAVTAGKELFAPHANNAGRLALQGIDLAVRVSDASKNEIPHKGLLAIYIIWKSLHFDGWIDIAVRG